MQAKIIKCQSMGFFLAISKTRLQDMFVPSHNAIAANKRQNELIHLFFI